MTKYSIATYTGTSGASSNGQGDPLTGTQYSKISSGTHYELLQNPERTFYRDITPTSTGNLPTSVFGAPPAAAANVSVDFDCIPITIESTFAVHDGPALCFLVGQEADFYLSGAGLTFEQHAWNPGHSSIDGVDFGATQNAADDFPGWTYRSSRTTRTVVTDLTSSHPSWYYDRKRDTAAKVKCNVTVKIGSEVLGSINVQRKLAVLTMDIESYAVYIGPHTVFDPNLNLSIDLERASAGTKDSTSGAQTMEGIVYGRRIHTPQIIKDALDDADWTYVQLCKRVMILDGGQPTNSGWRLDNTYPYGGYYWVESSMANYEWTSAQYPGRFWFVDTPSIGVSGRSSYVDSFVATCFLVLRPPVSGNQTWVEVPFSSFDWEYGSASVRVGHLWDQLSEYRSFSYQGTTANETTPNGAGVSLEGTSDDIPSENMDWENVIINGQSY